MRRPGHMKQTQYGFEWGPLEVTRVAHDERRLGYVLHIEAGGRTLEVRVSPAGRIIESDWCRSQSDGPRQEGES